MSIFQLSITADGIKDTHITYADEETQGKYCDTPGVVRSADGVEYLRFVVLVPHGEEGIGGEYRYVYLPLEDAQTTLRQLSDTVAREKAPSFWNTTVVTEPQEPLSEERLMDFIQGRVPEYDPSYAQEKGRDPEHGGRWCSECCTCHDDDEDYEPVPWDYDAHTPFENECHDMFVRGLVSILEAPTTLLFGLGPATDLPNRRARARRS